MIPLPPKVKLIVGVLLVGAIAGLKQLEQVDPTLGWIGTAVQILVAVELYFTVPPSAAKALFVLAFVSLSSTACMVAIPQPGQTPAQVQTCSTDATLHNVALYAAGVLSTGAATEAAIASQESGNTAQALGVAGLVTAGVGAAAVAGSAILGQAYNNDGCSPALPAGARK